MSVERAELIERAVAAYRTLGELAESIEDEWEYVSDLVDAYTGSLEALATGDAPREEAVAAIDEAIAEIGLIDDPHKAIDWLSTFPHVVGLALGAGVDGHGAAASEPNAGGTLDEPDEPDEDNPFRALLGRGR
jgi:hypothetical protein